MFELVIHDRYPLRFASILADRRRYTPGIVATAKLYSRHKKSKVWVASIVGPDKFYYLERIFIPCEVLDSSQKDNKDEVYRHYTLSDGYHEIQHWRNNYETERYFLSVKGDVATRVHDGEVYLWARGEL